MFFAIHLVHFAVSESMKISPGVLADMWKDEGKRTYDIEDEIRKILKEKGVCN